MLVEIAQGKRYEEERGGLRPVPYQFEWENAGLSRVDVGRESAQAGWVTLVMMPAVAAWSW